MSSQTCNLIQCHGFYMEVIITTILISSLVAQMKESACNAGDPGLISEGNGNPLQYSCPENPMDRGAWRATVHGVAKSQT